MQIKINGKIVGNLNRKNGIYSKIIDYNLNQVFKNPKYENAVGISQSILKRLIPLGLRTFDYFCINFPNEPPFRIISTLNNFMEKKEEIFFKGSKNADKQYILRMKYFIRLYNTQKQLNEVIKVIK